MPFDITPAGVSIETQAEVYAGIYARLQLAFDNEVDPDTESNIAQVVNILAELLATGQQVVLKGVRSFDPSAAQGVLLDQRSALTGSRREAAYGSTVTLAVTVSGAATIVDGDKVQYNGDLGNGEQWEAYGGPYALSAGTTDVTYRSVNTGPIPALASDDWTAVDTIDNLTSLVSAADAVLGAVVQSDPSFRVDRQREIYARGQGPLATINAVVSRVPGVILSRVYHNPRTPGADADGIPFKAFNVVVRTNPDPPDTPLQQLIWDAIWSVLGAGGEAYGSDYVGTSVDSEGAPQPVAFDILDNVPIEIQVTLTTTGAEQAVTPNMLAIVKAAVLAAATTLYTIAGRDVLALDYSSVVGALKDAGLITGLVKAVVVVRAVGDPSFDDVRTIGIREIPAFDGTRVVVSFA